MAKNPQSLAGLLFELGRIVKRQASTQQGGSLSYFHAYTLQLIRDEEGMTMKDLAALLQISNSSATALVDRLVEGKCVERRSDENNRKLVRLFLTKDGQTALEKNCEQREALLQHGFSRLSSQEKKTFEKILRTLIESYSQH